MRIISGKYKGRRLVGFNESHIRPTTDRVKESLFNILKEIVVDAEVLDLFSGTGNVSIEFLSRGVKKVDSVENSKKSIDIIFKNINLLGVGKEMNVIKKDVFDYLKGCDIKYDIVFIDPPFTKKIAHDTMIAVSESEVLREGAVVIIESSKREKLELAYGQIKCYDQRNFGDKILSFFK